MYQLSWEPLELPLGGPEGDLEPRFTVFICNLVAGRLLNSLLRCENFFSTTSVRESEALAAHQLTPLPAA